MEFSQSVYMFIAALVVGAVMLFLADKQRNSGGEWNSSVQWGYLLMMIGLFGFLAVGLGWSFTAVLLLFTVLTAVTWIWKKFRKDKDVADNNHFRDYMAGFFPIIAVVFVLRTFVAEPFQIPSSSMRPGLVKGDFILVNKFAYGIRVPVLNTVAIPTGSIQRGDVVVFNYPVEPQLNYIKRVVAIPGDVIEYKDKVLTVNDHVEHDTFIESYTYADDTDKQIERHAELFNAEFEDRHFEILKESASPSVVPPTWNYYQKMMMDKSYQSGLQENCEYAEDGSGFKCIIPEGKYFAMGDNRDSSADSRYWGFVGDDLIVGKAFLVWMNFGDMGRIGHSIQ